MLLFLLWFSCVPHPSSSSSSDACSLALESFLPRSRAPVVVVFVSDFVDDAERMNEEELGDEIVDPIGQFRTHKTEIGMNEIGMDE